MELILSLFHHHSFFYLNRKIIAFSYSDAETVNNEWNNIDLMYSKTLILNYFLSLQLEGTNEREKELIQEVSDLQWR